MVKTLAEVVIEAQGSRTDESIAAASQSFPGGGFTRQTLAAVKRGRPAKPQTLEALAYALGVDANEIRRQIGMPPREVAEPFIYGVPFLDQLNAHYRRQVVLHGYELYKAQRWSELGREEQSGQSEDSRLDEAER